MVRDFLPIYPGVAAFKPVGTLATCPGETEFCCIAPAALQKEKLLITHTCSAQEGFIQPE